MSLFLLEPDTYRDGLPTHPNTNRAQCRLTSLIKPTPLTTTLCRHLSAIVTWFHCRPLHLPGQSGTPYVFATPSLPPHWPGEGEEDVGLRPPCPTVAYSLTVFAAALDCIMTVGQCCVKRFASCNMPLCNTACGLIIWLPGIIMLKAYFLVDSIEGLRVLYVNVWF